MSYRSNSFFTDFGVTISMWKRRRRTTKKNPHQTYSIRAEATAAPLRYLERSAHDAKVETILWLWDPNNDRQYLCCKTYWKEAQKVTHWLENVFHHITMLVARTTRSFTRCCKFFFSAFYFQSDNSFNFSSRDYVKYRCYQEHTTNWRFMPIFWSRRIKVCAQQTKYTHTHIQTQGKN